jgi:hypothetical protein
MKRSLPIFLFFLICLPVGGEEQPPAAPSAVTFGGGVFLRYLHLDLDHWKDAHGLRLPRQDLIFSGCRVLASGPLSSPALRWRAGGLLGYAGKSEDDDLDDLRLGMMAGGITSGLSWRPGKFGLSVDVTAGAGAIVTEFKRAELERKWDVYERREEGLFYWEPLLSLDWQAGDIFVIRVQAGYSFLYGRGKEVGGFSGGLAFDFGKWI